MTGYMPLGWSQQHQSTLAKVALLAVFILIVGYITLSSLTRTLTFAGTSLPLPSDRDLGSLLSDNRQLTRSQCAVVYPLLYKEADRARGWYAGRGGVTLEGVDVAEKDGNARVAIIDQQVTYPPPRCHRRSRYGSCLPFSSYISSHTTRTGTREPRPS
jgi:hypothetical protein